MCFFVYGSADLRFLHSFPTRRSSDLAMISGVTRRACSWPRAARPEADPAARLRASWVRSEEHTSELQSRRELVCRLLLEKKNSVRGVVTRSVHRVLRDAPWRQRLEAH